MDRRAPGSRQDQGDAARNPRAPTPWEWGIAGLGLVLLLALLAYLVFDAVAGGDAPARPVLQVESVQHQDGGGFLVRVRAENRGRRTAANLQVRGILANADGSTEEAECVFDYVPPGSVRHGGLFFRHDPTGREVRLQPSGYIDP